MGEGGEPSPPPETVAGVAQLYLGNILYALELAALPFRSESLELELALGAHFAAVRPRFLVTGFGEVYRVPQFGGEGLFRISWLIP